MKDMGEANVILGIRIRRENGSRSLTQAHYLEKVIERINGAKSAPCATSMEPNIKLARNSGNPVSQLDYASLIGYLMYAMTSTRSHISFAVGKLSRYVLVILLWDIGHP